MMCFFRGFCCHHPRKRFSGCPQSRTPVCRNPNPKLHWLYGKRQDFGSKAGCAKPRLIFLCFLTFNHVTYLCWEDECFPSWQPQSFESYSLKYEKEHILWVLTMISIGLDLCFCKYLVFYWDNFNAKCYTWVVWLFRSSSGTKPLYWKLQCTAVFICKIQII